MVATLWIHRIATCDLLVYFGSRKDAYDFGIDFLEFHGDASKRTYDWDYVTMDEDDCHNLPASYDLQLSIHDGEFFHAGWRDMSGWDIWGSALISPEEALELGNNDQPTGFIFDQDTANKYAWMRDASATVASYYMRKTN